MGPGRRQITREPFQTETTRGTGRPGATKEGQDGPQSRRRESGGKGPRLGGGLGRE